MISDIISHFEKNYEKYKTTLKETSYDHINDEYTTTLLNPAYNYDEIIQHEIFLDNRNSCSQDAIVFFDNTILFIEFKNAILEQKIQTDDRGMLRKYKIKFNEDIKNKLLLKGVEGLYIFKKIISENNISLEGVTFKYILCYNENKNFSKSEEIEVDKILKTLRQLSNSKNINFGLLRLQHDFYYDEVKTLGREEFEKYMS